MNQTNSTPMPDPTDESDPPLFQLANTFRAFYGTFPCLHPIQKQAIAPILNGEDLILQSATGSGKTQAILAPCMEQVIRSGRTQAVLYIVPTRALAFDLKRRFDPVMQRLGLRLGIRTGDIKRSGQNHLMLTTPESLDVMMGSANPDLKGFLSRVRTMIIDEVHPLVYQYRGQQLAYLLRRLECRFSVRLQKIALSATIADPGAIIRFFGCRPDTVKLIETVGREIIPHLIHLKDEARELPALLDDLFNAWKYRKILIFANTRGRCDQLFAIANHQGQFRGVSELHYSNLRAKERQAAEYRFRRRSHGLCIATSTLELGIDVGDVDAVLLYEPPDSVSAFLQRIGRSNRQTKDIRFWGICRGERAGEQLLRFLGLLRQARQGAVEPPLAKTLPSVLAQQIISCLYEKKRISLPAIRNLFPTIPKTRLEAIFHSLRARGWLRNGHVDGLFQGGWRYRNCLFDRMIWSNFPETEEDYTLELSGQAIADLPKSVVRQLDPGDRVHIAGKRIQVLQIGEGERKRVLARAATHSDHKEILWLGAGSHVSYEVAQSIRALLRSPENAENEPGLFTRTRKLLQHELNRGEVVLANGIQVVRGKVGFYRYRTFLGSVGNLMLEWTIRDTNLKDLFVDSDEIGIDCSHWTDLGKLPLPVDRKGFQAWAKQHFKILLAPFSLNRFCSTLPEDLLVEELTDFLYDSRVARAFARYLENTSEIVSGDPGSLDFPLQESTKKVSSVVIDPSAQESLLAWEKQRWSTDQNLSVTDAPYRSGSLTGTIIGEYFRHHQCERWFDFHFLPAQHRPPRRTRVDNELTLMRMERGRQYEQYVLEVLREHGNTILTIEEHDAQGVPRPLKERFEESACQLQILAQQTEADFENPSYLAQGVFLLPASEVPRRNMADHHQKSFMGHGETRTEEHLNWPWVGIPDLIRISWGKDKPVLEIGDIKSTLSVRYHQKWQVAFYARLLEELIHSQTLSLKAEVADTGFLLTRGDSDAPQWHHFDLRPYKAAFPALLRNLGAHLSHPPSEAAYHLQAHCATCDYFEFCHGQALSEEDVQLLPRLTSGELGKLRQLGLRTMEDAHQWFELSQTADSPHGPNQRFCHAYPARFSPHQRERIQGTISAFMTNHISVRTKITRMFPKNISTLILADMLRDPVSSRPLSIGWRVLHKGKARETRVWNLESDSSWGNFSREFANQWEQGMGYGHGPHIVHFGTRIREVMETLAPLPHFTDLRQVILRHFDLPAPGNLTLFAMSHLLGLDPEPPAPDSLFHLDEDLSHEESLLLMERLWHWISRYLESDWEKQDWDLESEKSLAAAYLYFVEEERRVQEQDILSLQEHGLEERIQRFRAIGPLTFMGTLLDEQGRFLYDFKLAQGQGRSKFREGDFLKLAPVGTSDLQSGLSVILAHYDRHAGQLSVLSRQGRLAVNQRVSYSLEEDAADWNTPKLIHGVQTVFDDMRHSLSGLFAGQCTGARSHDASEWVRQWLKSEGAAAQLNSAQQAALELPFCHDLSLVKGPPGTGKTHLLGWMLIALIRQAQAQARPLRIAISALTHHAIDQVLKKVAQLVNDYSLKDFPARCVKWGRWTEHGDTNGISENSKAFRVEPCDHAEKILTSPYLILGATGYGLYGLFQSRDGTFPGFFDWVVFDEASQVLVPHALLSLAYAKGRFIFIGDVNQLPPIVLGEYDADKHGVDLGQSILGLLLNLYGPTQSVCLDLTYRMNREICEFPAQTWYDGKLCPAPGNANSRLLLKGTLGDDLLDQILDPEKPVVLVLADHQGSHQESGTEAGIMAQLACKLMDEFHVRADQIALISPHRAQNNAIATRVRTLAKDKDQTLPLIDTVERTQGAERDVILFGFTTSDTDFVMSEFLNNPNRFNVAITRARHKLIVVGSHAFFSAIPHTAPALQANACFKTFFEHCREQGSIFRIPSPSF